MADDADATLALRAAGVADPPALLERLARVVPVGAHPLLVAALARAADPELAVGTIERLAAALPDVIARLAREPERGAALVTVLGASLLVGRFMFGEPAAAELAFADGGGPAEARVPPPELDDGATPEELAQALRVFKRKRVLTIAVRDLLGLATLEETTLSLTRLAEEGLEVAVRVTRAGLVARHGDLLIEGRPAGFVVLGMGKLGGQELNFSSDVDLVYLYERDDVETTGGPDGTLSAREFCARLGEGVTRAFQQPTDEGIVFRVDLRLRPDGTNGPLANSAAAALLYYESWGQTWERAAYLKARPVAGDRAFGERFLSDLDPFVYRRFLDFGTIEDLKAMKGRVEAALGQARPKGIDVKLSRGGIREVEFVVQCLQLIHAGKDERIRCRNTLQALPRLVAARYLPADEAAALADAYRFLRDVEHKIQLVDERQTQRIPRGAEEACLARRLGYVGATARADFQAACKAHMTTVHASFAALFHASRAAIGDATDQRCTDALATGGDDDQVRVALEALGFQDLDGARVHLALLRGSGRGAPGSARRSKLLREIGPILLGAVAKAPDPDEALRNLADFLAATGARSSFLALLAENPSTLRVLVQLFGSSQFLSRTLVRHPEMLDNLVRADLMQVKMSRDAMTRELESLLAAADDYEARLDTLRGFQHEQFLRIGINDLERLLPYHAVSSQLTDLADACLAAAWHIADSEIRQRYPTLTASGRFAVVGMGKLGARELTYNSDLDLIFVYVPGPGDGDAAREYYTHLAQSMMTTLQVQTTEGRAYQIDTRLRPSGNAGPLVSSLEAFARYHEQSSQLWERQALIKARAVAGDPALGAEVEQIIERFVYASSITEENVAEIHRLRMRMERELAGDERRSYNVKTGRGGIVDVEFLTQMLQLRHGMAHPAVRQRATRHALAALAASQLLDEAAAADLDRSYGFLRTLTNRLRMERDRPVEEIEREGQRLHILARRLGYEGSNAEAAAQLLADYAQHSEAIRATYNRWFGVSD